MRAKILAVAILVLFLLTILVVSFFPAWMGLVAIGYNIAENVDPLSFWIAVVSPLVIVAVLWAILWFVARITRPAPASQ